MINKIIWRRINTMHFNKKGFTLIELIVVIVIIAILAAIAVPALTGYIDKGDEAKIRNDSHVAVEALQAWAVEKYAEGIKGDDLQDGAVLSPYQAAVGVSQVYNGSSPEQRKYAVGIDTWNSTSVGTRINIYNRGPGSGGVSGMFFWDGILIETKALTMGVSNGMDVVIAPYSTNGLATGTHKIGVVICLTNQLSQIQAMSYQELKDAGLLKEGNLTNINNNSTYASQRASQGGAGVIPNLQIMNYDPSKAKPAVNAEYIWKQIVDSYARNGIATDDNVTLNYAYFDEKNKLVEMEYSIKKGDSIQTCYFEGWDGDNYYVY